MNCDSVDSDKYSTFAFKSATSTVAMESQGP